MNAAAALQRVNELYGTELAYEGRCPGGEVGAYYARDPNGPRYVFKWLEHAGAFDAMTSVVKRVGRLRATGYPAPRYLPPYAVDGGAVVVQEAVEGEWRDDVDHELIEAVLRLNDLQVPGDDGDASSDWTGYIVRTLTEGADGYCIHETLRDYDRETRDLLRRIEAIGANLGTLPERDVVHEDFHHRNMLRIGSRLTAVVDWEGSRPGDRSFDLVTFCFGMSHAIADARIEDPVWERAIEIAAPEAIAAYVAHMSLKRVDWTIRHQPTEVDRLMPIVRRFMGRV